MLLITCDILDGLDLCSLITFTLTEASVFSSPGSCCEGLTSAHVPGLKSFLTLIANLCADVCPAALYGILFPRDKEAAFANYRMWESLGFVIAFAYSTFLCLEYKLYIMLGILVLTTITYPIVEYHEYKRHTLPEVRVSSLDKEKADENFGARFICQTQM